MQHILCPVVDPFCLKIKIFQINKRSIKVQETRRELARKIEQYSDNNLFPLKIAFVVLGTTLGALLVRCVLFQCDQLRKRRDEDRQIEFDSRHHLNF